MNGQELFHHYFMERNGLWKERVEEVDEKGFKSASSIARLVYSCEIGVIDQHASEDLKAVSAFLMVQADRIAALEAVAEIARIALVELQAIHDDWNRELSVDCVGVEHCTTAQTIAKLSAALDGVK